MYGNKRRYCYYGIQYLTDWTKYKYRIGYFGKQFDKLVENGEDISEYTRLANNMMYDSPSSKRIYWTHLGWGITVIHIEP